MVSAKMFIIENATLEKFKGLKDYSKTVDEIPQFDVKLKDTVENFKLDGNIISFDFQSDIKLERKIRGRTIPHVLVYRARVWCWFTEKGNYMLLFGNTATAKYLSGKIEKVVNELNGKAKGEESSNEAHEIAPIIIQKLELPTRKLLEIVQNDFVKINSSWWKKIGQEVRSAFLSGRLKRKESKEVKENEIYKEIAEKANDVTTINFLSERLGHNIVISRKQGSVGTTTDKIGEEDIIDYFKTKIYPYL